jgi:hypothetical protein
MAQAVSRRPPTAEARVRSWVNPCEIFIGQSGKDEYRLDVPAAWILVDFRAGPCAVRETSFVPARNKTPISWW